MAKEWTVEDLIRWRANDLKRRTPSHVVEMLSCENLLDSKVPLAAVTAVRQFRKLNEAARLRRAITVLTTLRGRPPSSVVDDLRDNLSGLLHEMVRRSWNRESCDTVVSAIEELIEARLGLFLGPGVAPDPRSNSFLWTPLGKNRQCRLGTMLVGEARHVGNDLYEAVLGTTRLAGAHALDVAKKRVEQAFLDAANAAVNGSL